MRLFSHLFTAALLCAVALAAPPAAAQMEGSVLFVAPHRLIITPGQRIDTIAVSNKSDRERRYDLSLIDQIMTEKGVTKRLDSNEKFEYSVKDMVTYVPRRFNLKPGESQVVRVKVKRDENLADGDYHSHLLFREVPLTRKDRERLQEERALAEKTVSFEIRTLYGIAVPIVVQQGKVTSDIGMNDLSLGSANGKQTVSIGFSRTGNAEASGKLSAEYVKGGGKPVTVIEPQWIRMYREAGNITKTFSLTKLPEGAGGGKLVVRLMRDEADPSKTITKEISLN